jgi:hypothetical protein
LGAPNKRLATQAFAFSKGALWLDRTITEGSAWQGGTSMRAKILVVAIGIAVAVGGLGWWIFGQAASGFSAEEFQAWADSMNANGYEISVDRISGSKDWVVLDDLVVANPVEGWQWTGAEARVAGSLDGEGMTINISGDQTLSYRIAGENQAHNFTAVAFRVTLEPNGDGGVGAVTVDMANVNLERGDDQPIGAARGQIRLDPGDGPNIVPDGSVVTVQFTNLVLPKFRQSAFGDTIKRVFTVVELQLGLDGLDPGAQIIAWQRSGRSLAKVTSAGLTWGLFSFEADGTLKLDSSYRPEGTLQAEVHNFFPALGPITAAGLLDAGAGENFKFLVVEEFGNPNPASLFMGLRIRDGQIELRQDEIGLPVINLGGLPPLLGLPPRE